MLNQFELRYNFQGPESRNYFLLVSNPPTGDSTFVVVTAAGLPTNVLWKKVNNSGAGTTFQDSITCVPGVGNLIRVNY